jgi:arginine-tRNA-protein transferase
LEPDNYTEEKWVVPLDCHMTFFNQCPRYLVFENYQRNVHHEPPSKITRDGFRRFLCSSPLKRSTMHAGDEVRKLGSYHHCYRLDGRLMAIGVIDLLPQCVSAVYFLYVE